MSGGWEDWEWDETLFSGAAEYYERGRLPYAPGLADAFAESLDLSGTPRLLDVGCGPGSVALRIADLYDGIVGVDADDGMITEARRLAAQRHVDNARWVQLRAEQLPAGLGQFRTVTFAASFHWMDRPRVAAIVRHMLDDRGVLVHVDNRHQDSLRESSLPAVPRAEIHRLTEKYLGPDRRAGASVRNTSPSDENDVFRAAGFDGPTVVVVPDGRHLERSVDDVVAEVFSNSSTTPHLLGDRQARFEQDLRDILANAAGPHGRFGVRLPDNALKIWHPIGARPRQPTPGP